MTKYFVATNGSTFIFCGGNLVCFLAISYLLIQNPKSHTVDRDGNYSMGLIFSIFAVLALRFAGH